MQRLLNVSMIFSLVLVFLFVISTNNVLAGWTEMKSGTEENLLAVWGSSETDIFAVGDNGIILHYDGSTWSKMDIEIQIESLRGVWGSSESDVFVVGHTVDRGRGIILHYDGLTWSEMQNVPKALEDVWGNSANDIYVVGLGGTVLHYDGSKWTNIDTGIRDTLHGVWASSERNIFTVGWDWDDTGHATILHYDGSTWTSMNSGSAVNLIDVWGSSPTDVFAVGGTILHYDGTSWTPLGNNYFGYGFDEALMIDVWGTSGTNVYAVGWSVSGYAFHYNGTIWTSIRTGVEKKPVPPLSGVWVDSEGDVFAVGFDGTILHYEPCPIVELYGESAEETEYLRCFRDDILSKTSQGQELIDLYYQWSPAVVKAMQRDEKFKEDVKNTVDEILLLIKQQ